VVEKKPYRVQERPRIPSSATAHQTIDDGFQVTFVEEMVPHIIMGSTARKDVIGRDQNRMSDSHDRALLTPPGREAVVLSGEVGVTGVCCAMRRLDQSLMQGAVAGPVLPERCLQALS
jgi:hypothetical protein